MGWNYNKRAFKHNYRAPFIYHIVLRKKEGFPGFGTIAGNAQIPYGIDGCAYIKENIVGQIISKSIIGLPKKFPIIQIYQHIVMPDHVHILLRVLDWSEFHLDFYIGEFTDYIAKRISREFGKEISRDVIFEDGYCDKPLLLTRSLDSLYNYIRMNPHRLAMRIQYPEFFRRVRNLEIDGKTYEAYGNLFLLRNPDKAVVKISRRYSEEKKEELKRMWLESAEKGSVIVSPFIAKEEKKIRELVEQRDGKIILITNEAFSERFKPAEHNFNLCSSGKLLIISLGLPPNSSLNRETCNQMNDLAIKIAT